MLRWLTAGESHGPLLVAIAEGFPAGVAVTTADIEQQLARRRLGHGRGARMKFEQDAVRVVGGDPARPHHGWPGRHRGRQQRVAEVGDRDGGRPGRPGAPGRAGAQRAADASPARTRRPRRHAEVRPRRCPPGARAGQCPRDRSPGGPGSRGSGVPAPDRRRRGGQPRRVDRCRRGACRCGPDAGPARRHRRRPGAVC